MAKCSRCRLQVNRPDFATILILDLAQQDVQMLISYVASRLLTDFLIRWMVVVLFKNAVGCLFGTIDRAQSLFLAACELYMILAALSNQIHDQVA